MNEGFKYEREVEKRGDGNKKQENKTREDWIESFSFVIQKKESMTRVCV